MRLSFLYLSVFFFASFPVFSQVTPVTGLQRLYDDYPQEKIYLWFNKAEYVAGETVWFKIYVFSGYELSEISKTVYVELYDAQKKPIATQSYPLLSGIGQGSIDLSENLQENVYYIRAYTKWMLNFDAAFEYVKPLLVYNPASGSRLIPKRSDWNATVHPEGNTLITGYETRCAVRLRSHTELPESWSGTLHETGSSNVITTFNSLDRNIALFSFVPDASKRYSITVTDDKGISRTTALPSVRSAGVSVRTQDDGDSILVKLNFSNAAANDIYAVVGQMQNQLVYHARFKPAPNMTLAIPAKELFNGILHITVFDASNNPVAERLVFTNPRKLLAENNVIESINVPGASRKEASLDITIDSLEWNSYGLSVTTTAITVPTMHDNILSSLWLTSDINSNIHHPARYFTDSVSREALDALLMSEKWTRFNWYGVLNNSFPTIKYLPDNFLTFSGAVYRNKKLLPNREVTLILYAPDSSSMLMLGKTDSTGTLTIGNLAFSGNLKAFYQLNEKKGNPQNIDIKFSSHIKPVAFTGSFPEVGFMLAPRVSATVPDWVINTQEALKNEEDANDQYKTLQEVILRSTTKSAKDKLNESLTSGLFRTQNDIIFDFVNEQQNAIAYTNILQWLDGRVAGLSVEVTDGVATPYIRGNSVSIFIDEMPIDAEGAGMISVSDIAMIKIIKGPLSFVTGGGQGGAIAIYTLKGNMRPAQREPSLNNSVLTGYDTEKMFYQPDYSNNALRQPQKDVRDQLLWTTLLLPTRSITTSTQKFFTNDKPGKLRIVVQGFTEKGMPVYSEREF